MEVVSFGETIICFRETKRYVKKLSVTFTKISCFFIMKLRTSFTKISCLRNMKVTEYSTHSEPHRPALRATRSIM